MVAARRAPPLSPPSLEQFINQPNLSAPSVFSLRCSLDTIALNEIYNLVAQSHVDVSFEIPDYPTLSAPSVFSFCRSLDTISPDEIYNLVAQSYVDVSFEILDYPTDVVAFSLFQVVAISDLCPLSLSLWSKHRRRPLSLRSGS
ncbi:hypothetical protein ACLB2K_032854 [Fragaria x ananassa]